MEAKRNAPSTAATGIGAKIIKLQVNDTTAPAKRQGSGQLIPFYRPVMDDSVRLLYRRLLESEAGRDFVNALVLTQITKREA